LTVETVFKGSSDIIEWVFKERRYNHSLQSWQETPIDFVSGIKATSMKLYMDNVEIGSSPEEIKYFDGGRVQLHLGESTKTKLNQAVPVSIKVFSLAMPEGETILHPRRPMSNAKLFTIQT